MSNEESSEDRLTKNEFSELIQHLSMQEILAIEYLVDLEWAKLFSRKNVSFTCNLCVVDSSSFKNLLDHINGKRHILEMEEVKQLYHPDYTYPKSVEKKSIVAKSAKNNENSFCINRQENLEKCNYNNSFGKKQEVQRKKTDIRNRNVIEIKPTLLKSQYMENSSLNIPTNVKGMEINKEQHEFNKHLFSEKETNKEQQKNYVNSVEDTEINKEQQKDNTDSNVEKVINNEQITQNNILAPKSASQASGNKNKTERNFNLIAKSLSSCNENIKGDINCESKSVKEIGVKKLIISKESENSQGIAEEKNLGDNKNNEKYNSKTPKIVINPAAALASKKDFLNKIEKKNCEGKKPNYQTDKIIIPTARKNKIHDEEQISSYKSKSHLSDFPIFSVKSYSSKSDDIDVHGILGVEYVIKILRHKNDSFPRYECGLCELVLDGFTMQRHLEGYNHRLKYCEKHFPTAVRHYRHYMQRVPEHELFKVMTPVLEKLAKAIENHHGRSLPYECYERDFSLNRHEILAKAFSCRHASEQYGPTFTHVVGADEIDEYINVRHSYAPPTASRFAIFDIKPGENKARSDSVRHQDVKKTEMKDLLSRDRNRHTGRTATNYLGEGKDYLHKSYMSSGLFDDLRPPASIYGHANRGRVREHIDDKTYNLMVDNFLKGTLKGISGSSKLRDYQKRSASPSSELNSKKRKSLSPLRDDDIWQAYRHMVDQELNYLNERFQQIRKDPETHPSYNEEWQKFWKRRKDELISAGLDHRKYNYQPEWVKYIKLHTEELYNKEVENIKIKCREQLRLPMINSHLMDIKYHVQVATTLNECLDTPLKADARPLDGLAKNLSVEKLNLPQVVSVLRLMTALEDSLGSLGPKIIDLLSKALQAEKYNPALVNAIILNDDNCSLIETAKEKFKGLLITGLFESAKERVFQKVINDTDDLLKYAYQNRQFLSSQRSSETTHRTQNCTSSTERSLIKGSLSSPENLLPAIDKKELASKLATSLIAQGKTDFNPQQLQQLLSVYTLIEKKKRGPGSFVSNKETTVISKKLSETLSDLLKSSSTSGQNSVSVDRQLSSSFKVVQQNAKAINTSSTTSFNSVLQNSSDNYLINSTHPQLPESAYSKNTIRGNQLEQNSDYYKNNRVPYQQNKYNNDLYQNNNRTAKNWMLNSNMEINSNYDIGRPNSYNQSTNWRNF